MDHPYTPGESCVSTLSFLLKRVCPYSGLQMFREVLNPGLVTRHSYKHHLITYQEAQTRR